MTTHNLHLDFKGHSPTGITAGHAAHPIHAEVGRKLNAGKSVANLLSSEKKLLTKNSRGETLLHLAARFHYIGLVPRSNLNERTLLIRNNEEESIVFTAAKAGALKWIPETFLTEAILLARNRDGANCLHAAAENTGTTFIPKHLLTETNYKNLTHSGFSPLHVAAYGRSTFLSIPGPLRISSCLDCVAKDGATPLHILALRGNLHLLPLEQLTSSRLTRAMNFRVCHDGKLVNTSKTVLELIRPSEFDYFLGSKLPSTAKNVFGEEWWARNQNILEQQGILNTAPQSEPKLELF